MALTRKITRIRMEAFLSRHTSDERVLDIGSGTSGYSRFFPNRVTLDIDPARRPDVIADVHAMPFKDNTFSVVLCTEALEHFHSPERAIDEIRRVLSPGGTLILTTRFIFPIHDAPNDFFRYTKYGLRYLFRDWDIISIQEETNTKDAFAVLLQRIGFQSKIRGGKLTKFFIFLLAKLIFSLPNWLMCEYGDIKKSITEHNILASGYYMVCKKRLTE